MSVTKKIISSMLVVLTAMPLFAQTNGSNSSYSRFGLGLMNDQSQGFNRGMSGVSQGIRSGQKVNMLNPASYSAIDSLSFIFDVGMGLQFGHFTQGSNSTNARNTSLEYVNAGFHVAKGLGMSFGFVPYSTIGYNFSSSARVGYDYTTAQSITTKTTYYGNGGLHQLYFGVGWNPFAKLSIGANASYVWGDYNHSLSQATYVGGSANDEYNSPNAEWTSDIHTYKLDIGAQYPIRLTRQDWLTLGATVSIGHGIKSDVSMLRYTSLKDTTKVEKEDAFDMPYTVSAGASWQHQGRITVAADYTLEKWDGCKVPVSNTTTEGIDIDIRTDQYMNRHKISIGAEYIKNPLSRTRYADRIRYRIGGTYSSPYVKVNGVDGPRELGVSAGLSLPLKNTGKSLINVSAQWLNRSASSANLITENYFMLHLGVTFNERWFQKWKIN